MVYGTSVFVLPGWYITGTVIANRPENQIVENQIVENQMRLLQKVLIFCHFMHLYIERGGQILKKNIQVIDGHSA